MQDDNILRAVQEEQPVAEYEQSIVRSALRVAAAIGVIFAMIMTIAEYLIVNNIDFGKPFLIALTAGLADIIERRSRKERKSLLFFGILKLIFAAFCLLLYIVCLIGVS